MNKAKYQYFGNGVCEGSFGEITRFGQEISLTDEQALDVINSGAGILTSEQFYQIGFTQEEQSKRSARKGPHFLQRHCTALEGMAILRNHLQDKIRSAIAERNEGDIQNVKRCSQ